MTTEAPSFFPQFSFTECLRSDVSTDGVIFAISSSEQSFNEGREICRSFEHSEVGSILSAEEFYVVKRLLETLDDESLRAPKQAWFGLRDETSNFFYANDGTM